MAITLPDLRPNRFPLTIGSDPEFVFEDNFLGVLEASHLLKQSLNTNLYQSRLGRDGDGTLGELRPAYALNPRQHTKNIRQVLEFYVKKHPELFFFNLLPHQIGCSLGGHIHFGSPSFGDDSHRDRLSMLLDTCLGIPSIFLENNGYAQNRHCGYGKLTSWRPQDHGFEYRTPSSWLASEKLARAILSVGFVTAQAYLENADIPNLADNTPNWNHIEAAFRHADLSELVSCLPSTFKLLRSFPDYKEYKPEIESFIDMVKDGKPVFEGEIKAGWGLTKLYQQHIPSIASNLVDVFWKTFQAACKFSPKSIFGCPSGRRFVAPYNSDHYATAFLARSVNEALYLCIDKHISITKRIYLFGFAKPRGDLVYLNCLSPEFDDGFRFFIKSLYQMFTGKKKIALKIDHISDSRRLGLGFEIRQKTIRLAQAIVILATLYTNPQTWIKEEALKKKLVEECGPKIAKHKEKNKKFIFKLSDSSCEPYSIEELTEIIATPFWELFTLSQVPTAYFIVGSNNFNKLFLNLLVLPEKDIWSFGKWSTQNYRAILLASKVCDSWSDLVGENNAMKAQGLVKNLDSNRMNALIKARTLSKKKGLESKRGTLYIVSHLMESLDSLAAKIEKESWPVLEMISSTRIKRKRMSLAKKAKKFYNNFFPKDNHRGISVEGYDVLEDLTKGKVITKDGRSWSGAYKMAYKRIVKKSPPDIGITTRSTTGPAEGVLTIDNIENMVRATSIDEADEPPSND